MSGSFFKPHFKISKYSQPSIMNKDNSAEHTTDENSFPQKLNYKLINFIALPLGKLFVINS